MAKTFPAEAEIRAICFAIPLSKAIKNVASELNGKIVAAKKADKKSVSSAMRYSL